jgi:hypothetical protein
LLGLGGVGADLGIWQRSQGCADLGLNDAFERA